MTDNSLTKGAPMNADDGSAESWLQNWLANVLPSRAILFALLVPLTIMKLVQVFYAPPIADEAYYWLWGQNLALSYYDHPPLIAWVQSIMSSIFGWNIIGLRAGSMITFAGTLAILWFWSKRLVPTERCIDFFLATLVFWLCMPILMRFQSIAHNDHLFIFFALLCAHFMALFYKSVKTEAPLWKLYYAACIALGIAGLAKYNAVFIGLGFGVWVVATGMGRRLLRNINLWLGGALAALIQAPVLLWNIENNWPSFRYNLNDRIGQSNGTGFIDNLLQFGLTSAMMLSPVFVLAMVRLVLPAAQGEIELPFRAIGRWVFLVSTGIFIYLCTTNTVLYYWNLAAYLFVLPVVLFMIRSRLEFLIHAFYGVFIGAWLLTAHGIYPTYKANGDDLRDYDISYGLSEIAGIVEAEEKRVGADFVMTTDYRTASLLSFATGRSDIKKMGLRNDQFDIWFNQQELQGKSAIVLADSFLPTSELVDDVFGKVTLLREIKVEKFGYDIHTYQLYLAENYSGAGAH